jgi:hypothetical protein
MWHWSRPKDSLFPTDRATPTPQSLLVPLVPSSSCPQGVPLLPLTWGGCLARSRRGERKEVDPTPWQLGSEARTLCPHRWGMGAWQVAVVQAVPRHCWSAPRASGSRPTAALHPLRLCPWCEAMGPIQVEAQAARIVDGNAVALGLLPRCPARVPQARDRGGPSRARLGSWPDRAPHANSATQIPQNGNHDRQTRLPRPATPMPPTPTPLPPLSRALLFRPELPSPFPCPCPPHSSIAQSVQSPIKSFPRATDRSGGVAFYSDIPSNPVIFPSNYIPLVHWI